MDVPELANFARSVLNGTCSVDGYAGKTRTYLTSVISRRREALGYTHAAAFPTVPYSERNAAGSSFHAGTGTCLLVMLCY